MEPRVIMVVRHGVIKGGAVLTNPSASMCGEIVLSETEAMMTAIGST